MSATPSACSNATESTVTSAGLLAGIRSFARELGGRVNATSRTPAECDQPTCAVPETVGTTPEALSSTENAGEISSTVAGSPGDGIAGTTPSSTSCIATNSDAPQ